MSDLKERLRARAFTTVLAFPKNIRKKDKDIADALARIEELEREVAELRNETA